MLKRTLSITLLLVLSLLLAACGSSGSTGSSSTGRYGNSSSATPTTAPASSGPVIKTTTSTINGTSEMILTNTQGMTLYYFTPDSATTAACASGCTSAWPPLLFQGSGTPSSVTSLSGMLSAVNDGNGMQVEYNGHPLYTFSGDTAAGQTNGEGKGGKWFVAAIDLKVQGGQQATPQPHAKGY